MLRNRNKKIKKIESCLFLHSDLFWNVLKKIINLSLKNNIYIFLKFCILNSSYVTVNFQGVMVQLAPRVAVRQTNLEIQLRILRGSSSNREIRADGYGCWKVYYFRLFLYVLANIEYFLMEGDEMMCQIGNPSYLRLYSWIFRLRISSFGYRYFLRKSAQLFICNRYKPKSLHN